MITRPNPSARLVRTASLADANGDGVASVGETPTHAITLTNTGDVPLDDATISDPMLPDLACSPAQDQPIEVGQVRTCTGTHVVTEADAPAGLARNVATVTSPTAGGIPPAEHTEPVTARPDATVDKAAALDDADGNGVGNGGRRSATRSPWPIPATWPWTACGSRIRCCPRWPALRVWTSRWPSAPGWSAPAIT